MSVENSVSQADWVSEGKNEVAAWLSPETKRLVDVAHRHEGYDSRSAYLRAILREHFGLEHEGNVATSVGSNQERQTVLTDGGHNFDLSDD